MIEVKFLGHAALYVELDGRRLIFDPWIEGNPQSCTSVE